MLTTTGMVAYKATIDNVAYVVQVVDKAELQRTLYFPGLGWLLSRRLYEEVCVVLLLLLLLLLVLLSLCLCYFCCCSCRCSCCCVRHS